MPETTDADARYALDLVSAICAEVGPGVAGSPQERQRADRIAEELRGHLGAANVVVEEFAVAPGAFVGTYPICGLLLLGAALSNAALGRVAEVPPSITAAVGLAFAIAAALVYVLEFVLGLEFLDPLFRKARSVNVIGTLRSPGTGDPKRLLLLSGHHDSAAENTWLRLAGYGFLFLTAAFSMGLITMLVMSVVQFVGVLAGHAGAIRSGTLGWATLIFPMAPGIVFALFFTRCGKGGGTVPGAADNLSGCALAVTMCRYLVAHPSEVPLDTEIRFVTFGSEEAGYRGARRYVARHLDELRRLDARLLNFETIAHPTLQILTSDRNGTVKNAPEIVRSLAAAATRAGVPHRMKPAVLGVANDSGPFSLAGLKAVTLLGLAMPQQMVAFYHQGSDRPEVLSVQPLWNALRLASEWVHERGE